MVKLGMAPTRKQHFNLNITGERDREKNQRSKSESESLLGKLEHLVVDYRLNNHSREPCICVGYILFCVCVSVKT